MKSDTFLYVSTSPYNTPSWHFYELHLQPFPQKQVNVRTTESSCSRFYVTSGLGSCPVANQDGGILTYFDDPWKIEDLTKSKNISGKLLQKISCIILVKKIFGVRCTLKKKSTKTQQHRQDERCDFYMTNLIETLVGKKWNELEKALKLQWRETSPAVQHHFVSIFLGLTEPIGDCVRRRKGYITVLKDQAMKQIESTIDQSKRN